MKTTKEILEFIIALILLVPTALIVLLAYGGMLLIREVLIFMGRWEEE